MESPFIERSSASPILILSVLRSSLPQEETTGLENRIERNPAPLNIYPSVLVLLSSTLSALSFANDDFVREENRNKHTHIITHIITHI